MINLLCDLTEYSTIQNLYGFNQVVAWSLRDVFRKLGHECRFVSCLIDTIPEADYTIDFSITSRRRMWEPGYYRAVRTATKKKLAMYIDADYKGCDKPYDIVFTVVEPLPESSEKFVYGGWGADPRCFYPEQAERAVFLDSYLWGWHEGRYDHIYKTYEEVLPKLPLKTYQPQRFYEKSPRLRWVEIQTIMRKAHYFCCTQIGEAGLMRIEAATSGALLVVPEELYMPRTMSSLEHRIWRTSQELIEILGSVTDPKSIRDKALKHSWDATASRIISGLQK